MAIAVSFATRRIRWRFSENFKINSCFSLQVVGIVGLNFVCCQAALPSQEPTILSECTATWPRGQHTNQRFGSRARRQGPSWSHQWVSLAKLNVTAKRNNQIPKKFHQNLRPTLLPLRPNFISISIQYRNHYPAPW